MKCFETIQKCCFWSTICLITSDELTCTPDVTFSPGSWCVPHNAEKLRKMNSFVLWYQVPMGIITFNMPRISNTVVILKYIYTCRPQKNIYLRTASYVLPLLWEWTVANLHLMGLPYWRSAVNVSDFWCLVHRLYGIPTLNRYCATFGTKWSFW